MPASLSLSRRVGVATFAAAIIATGMLGSATDAHARPKRVTRIARPVAKRRAPTRRTTKPTVPATILIAVETPEAPTNVPTVDPANTTTTTIAVATPTALAAPTIVPEATTTTTDPGSTTTTVAAPPTTTQPAISPAAYLDVALDRIGRASFKVQKGVVDMALIRANARHKASAAVSIADTYPAIREALSALGDRHSSFADPEAAKRLTQGTSTGFGYDRSRGGITFPYPGGPAALSGMRELDHIVAVNGRPTEAPTTADVALDTMRLLVVHYGESAPVELTITRAKYDSARMPVLRQFGRIAALELPGSLGDRAKTTAYIQAGIAVVQAVNQVDTCGWVLDLRRNSGGFPYPMFAAIAPLVGEGPFLSQARTDRTDAWILQGGRVTIGGVPQTDTGNTVALRQPSPVAILLSGSTASAGEAAALAFAGRPDIRTFGEPTVGLTSTNVAYSMPDGAVMQVTTSYDVDRSGVLRDGPIAPDQPIPVEWASLGTPADPILNAATAWLNDQSACRNVPVS